MARGGQTGRIHLHQRNTDDVTQVIGVDNSITAEHADDIIATEQRAMENKTCKEYRCQIARIYKWWMEHYPDYFENGTWVLTDNEKNDITKFHHTNERDIIYGGLNVQYVMAFLSAKKKKSTKPDGTIVLSSVSDINKYDDAIKWGALHAEQALPSSYYSKMEGFILSYGKEHKQVQKEGRTDEQEADPITSTLFD